MVFALLAVGFGLVSLAVFGDAVGNLAWIPAVVAFPTVPLAIGIAVLRYHLYEIDRIVSRTIGYALVTVMLALGFVVLVVGLQASSRLASTGRQHARCGQLHARRRRALPAAPAAGPVVRRPALRPGTLRRRATVAAFAARLRDQVDLRVWRASSGKSFAGPSPLPRLGSGSNAGRRPSDGPATEPGAHRPACWRRRRHGAVVAPPFGLVRARAPRHLPWHGRLHPRLGLHAGLRTAAGSTRIRSTSSSCSCAFVTLPSVGAVLAILRPRNPIGWLFLIASIGFTMGIFSTEYVTRSTSSGRTCRATRWWTGSAPGPARSRSGRPSSSSRSSSRMATRWGRAGAWSLGPRCSHSA